LTSYSPSYKNGDWRQFDRTFDLTDADVDSQNNLNFAFVLPTFSTTSSTPFHLGTVHIDYGMIAP
jgi:GH18 family chitinase